MNIPYFIHMKIGIDIGGSHIASGIVLESGKFIGKESRDLNLKDKDLERIEEIIIDIIKSEIRLLLDRFNYEVADIKMIGISAPGSPKDGKLKNLVNLGIKEFDIKSKLEEIYDTEIKLKNDGKCAALAEKKYGNLKEYSDCVFLCIGTGVGSGVFLNNRLLEATNFSGFELGHMIINKDGIECNCGNKGCFETYASMKRFKRNTLRELELDENIQSEEMQEYIRQNINEPKVNEWVNKYLDNVIIGLLNVINIFEPEAICFGGSFSYYDDIFLPILQEKLDKQRFNKDGNIKLVVAKLRNDAGIIGATLI